MYIVQEIQTTNNQTALLPPLTYEDRLQAESAFHSILASASISSVDIHTVMLYTETGAVQRLEFYDHREATDADNI